MFSVPVRHDIKSVWDVSVRICVSERTLHTEPSDLLFEYKCNTHSHILGQIEVNTDPSPPRSKMFRFCFDFSLWLLNSSAEEEQ